MKKSPINEGIKFLSNFKEFKKIEIPNEQNANNNANNDKIQVIKFDLGQEIAVVESPLLKKKEGKHLIIDIDEFSEYTNYNEKEEIFKYFQQTSGRKKILNLKNIISDKSEKESFEVIQEKKQNENCESKNEIIEESIIDFCKPEKVK